MTDGDATAQAVRKGRPAGKRGTFTFRVTTELRGKLEAAASAIQRPVSEEIERRLEASFERDISTAAVERAFTSSFDTMLGGEHNVELFRYLSHAIFLAEHGTGKRWTDDAEVRERVHQEVVRLLPYALNRPISGKPGASGQIEEHEAARRDVLSRVAPDEEDQS